MPVIREKRQYGSVGPIGAVRMNTGASEKYAGIAQAAQAMTSLAIKEMGRQSQKLAEQAAQELSASQITTINPKTGKPEALDAIANFGFIGRTGSEAYERVVAERFQQSIDNEIKLKAGEIAAKYENNPYAPEKYEEQMVAYLEAMAQSSEKNGKATAYTNYIINEGTKYITATKLNMMQERIRLNRAKTTQSILDNFEDRTDLIRQKASMIASMPEGSERNAAQAQLDALRQATIDSINDGEKARLVKNGATRSAEDTTATVFGEAYIAQAMEGLDPTSAANLTFAIESGIPSDLPDDLLKIYNEATKYMYRTVKGVDGKDVKVLNYEALDGVAKAAKAKVYELQNDFEINLPIEKLVSDAFVNESVGLAGQLAPLVFADDSNVPLNRAADLIEQKLNEALGQLQGQYLDPKTGMTLSEYNAAARDIRSSLAQGLLITAYDNYRGSPSDAKMQILDAYNRKSSDGLTGVTKSSVDALIKTSVPIEDDARIEEFIIDLSSNDARNSAKFAEQQKAVAYNELSNLRNDVLRGSEEAYAKSLTLGQSEYFSGTQQASNKASTDVAYASSFVGKVMRGYVVGTDGKNRKVTSGDLALAYNYALGGKSDGLLPELKDAVDKGLKYTDGESLAAAINRREVALSKIEADQRTTAAASQLISDIVSDKIINNPSNTDRDTVEAAVLKAAKTPNFFESSEMFDPSSPAAQLLYKSTMSGVLPSTLKTSLESLAGGHFQGSAEAAKNILTFYSQMSNQPRGNSIVNAFSGLPETTTAKLEAIAQIHYTTGDEIGAIAAQMAENQRDDGFVKVKRREFGASIKSKSPDGVDTTTFIMSAIPDAANNKDALNTLVPLADYLFGNLDAETVKIKLENFYDRTFLPTQGYVIDYGSRKGDRSRYALQAAIPDDKVRTFFVEKVNRELKSHRVSMQPIGYEIENRAFLMPMGVSNGGVIYMAVQKSGGLLVPIPNPAANGMPFAFSTAEPDVSNYAKSIGSSIDLDQMTMDDVLDLRNDQFKKNQRGMGSWMANPAGAQR